MASGKNTKGTCLSIEEELIEMFMMPVERNNRIHYSRFLNSKVDNSKSIGFKNTGDKILYTILNHKKNPNNA